MLRKMVIMSALASFSLPSWSNGFYAGVGTGPEFANFNKNTTISSNAGDFYATDNTRLSGTGMFGSMFGGYAWTHRAFYLAGEANLDFTNVKAQTSNDEFIHQNFSNAYFRMKRVIGLSVLPGYIYSPTTLFYARLGYALGYFSLSSAEAAQSNMNRNLSGICFGLGVNQTFTDHISGRMEYKQINYQSTGSTEVLSTVVKNTNIAPTTGQVEFAVMYHF